MSASDAHTAIDGARQVGGRYRVVSYIAKGGMAEVWEGYDSVLSRPVAIKILLAHLATDKTVLERFRREAVTAAGLTHPGVIATYDTGLDGGMAWIVMELVRGRTLRHLMSERGALEPLLAVSIAGQITDALAAAHRAGLVHRDVKPGNVLLCDDEGPIPRAKVTDFGIAKAAEGIGGDLTRTGIVLGTPKYLSPEQVEGTEPDARADLYSLGVVLFEMLTGRPPFSGTTDMATALSHLRDQPPRVSELRPQVPREIDDIVAGLLVKDRAQRTPSAAALRHELAAAACHLGPARPRQQDQAPALPHPTSPSAIAGGVGAGGNGAVGMTARHATWGQASSSPNGGPHGSPAVGAGAPCPPSGWGPPAVDLSNATVGRPPTRVAGPSPTPAIPGVLDDLPPRDRPGPVGGLRGRRGPVGGLRGRRGPGIVVACLVVAGVVVIGLLVARAGSAGGGSPASHPGGNQPLALSHVAELVAPSHPEDNPGALPNLIDGDPSTTWSTDMYSSPAFGGYYQGLGVMVELNGAHTLHDLTVTSTTQGWSAEAYAADSRPPREQGVAAWGTRVGSVKSVNGNATLSLTGHKGRWVMLWLTNLGPAQRVTIGELSVD